MKKIILVLTLTMMGCQANAWSLKDLESIATEVTKGSTTQEDGSASGIDAVSYTHLTLPTIYSV